MESFICTTADIRCCSNKSYLRMTGNFIDKHTYLKCSYVLGCRHILNSRQFSYIREVMNDITYTYRINNSYISHTVTGNASDFGKVFRIYL